MSTIVLVLVTYTRQMRLGEPTTSYSLTMSEMTVRITWGGFEYRAVGLAHFYREPYIICLHIAWMTGQNGNGQNGTDKMVWTKWYTDKMVLDKMVRAKWHGQNEIILYFVQTLI